VQRIAIAGATGYIGGRLAPRLLEAGYSLRCLVRSPRKLEGRDWTSDPRVEVWPSDLDVHPSLTRDLSGCDVAFYLVHSMMSSDRAYAEHQLALEGPGLARSAGGWPWAAPGPSASRSPALRRRPRLLAGGRHRTGSLAVLARRNEITGLRAPGLSCGSRWGVEVHALPDCLLRASGSRRIALLVRGDAVSRRRLSDDARRYSA